MNTSGHSDSTIQPNNRAQAQTHPPPASSFIKLPQLDAVNTNERAQAALLFGTFLVIIAAILRIGGIGAENLWTDEITMVNIGLSGWEKIVGQFNGGRPPAYVFISYIWTVLFGTGEVISRLPSCFASILSVAVLFHLGTKLFSQRIGFLCALLLAVTEFHIYYAQTDRYYAFYVLTVLLSYLFFYRMFKSWRVSDTLLYIAFTALALYTHAHGIFIIASQGIFFLWVWVSKPQWRKYRVVGRWLTSQFLLVLVILPGVWEYFLADLLGNIAGLTDTASLSGGEGMGVNWLAEPTIGSIARALIRFLFFQVYYLNLYGIFTAIIFLAAGMTLYISRFGTHKWEKAVRSLPHDFVSEQSNRSLEWGLVITWLLGMLLLPWILSFIVTPMFYDRYVLGSSLAFYLILALIVVGLRYLIPIQVTTITFLCIVVPGLFAYYTYPTNEDWLGLTNYLKTNLQSGDVIVILTSEVHLGQPLEALDWYYSGTDRCELYEDKLNDSATVAGLTTCLEGHQRAWIVGMRWQGDYERLAEIGYSGSLVEFFNRYDAGRWQLIESWDGDPFFEMGLYLYADLADRTPNKRLSTNTS